MAERWVRRAVLVACAVLVAAAALAGEGRPEKLIGLTVKPDDAQVVFEVYTTGCTEKSDFRIERSGDGFTLVRLHPDTCKMMPLTTTVVFTFAELGVRPHAAFTIGNRFAPDTATAALP